MGDPVNNRSAAIRAVLAAGILTGVLAAGCVCIDHAPPREPSRPAARAAPIATPQPAPVLAPQAAPTVVAAPETRAAPVPAKPVEPVRPASPTAVPRPPAAQTAGNTRPTPQAAPTKPAATAATASAPPPVPKAAPVPVAPRPSAPPLDLTSLETRLRETKAIGVFTKISLKNQVDDLLVKFRAYHKRQGAFTLPELRRSYDVLLLKVLSLLQDSDPSLARDIVASRSAIWGILADPKKFSSADLMAGEML
jgi:hypothetical protein